MRLQVLLVDDSPGDVRLTQEAFREYSDTVQLHVAADGADAMDFLKKAGDHADATCPDLILLDLNMPRMDGRAVLASVKGDISLTTIPVVVLTMSDDEADIRRSYELQANAYLTKPVQLDAFEGMVRVIRDFWLTNVALPPQVHGG